MFLKTFDELAIKSVVLRCKCMSSLDADNVSMLRIKTKNTSFIHEPSMHFFNLSFKTCVFSSSMKSIPILKNRKNVSNYTPQLCKILENIFAKKLISFISSNHILSNCQYDFRENLQLPML